MLDQLSCAVGALHFGEIWNQLGEGGPNCPNVSPAPGPLSLPHGHGTALDPPLIQMRKGKGL